jgi:hypothetical protein
MGGEWEQAKEFMAGMEAGRERRGSGRKKIKTTITCPKRVIA